MVARLAFYDLDRTITRAPTWSAFLLFAARRQARWRLGLAPVAASAALAYKLRLIGRDRLKELMHGLMLGRTTTRHRLAALADRFAEQTVERNIRPLARSQIAADRTAGYRVVLATAAHRFYANAIARQLGIADVIATEAAVAGTGEVFNRLDGPNVYGPSKLAAVQAWLAAQGIAREDARVRFYSDHVSDAPCLSFADEAFAVNPHRPLAALAVAKGWRILDWHGRPEPAGRDEGQPCVP